MTVYPAPKPEARKKKDTKRARADKMERRVGKKLGMRQQPNSGAIASRPSDLVNKSWLTECKYSDATSSKGEQQIVLKRLWLVKNMQEAEREKRFPSLVFQFANSEDRFVVIPEWAFERFVQEKE